MTDKEATVRKPILSPTQRLVLNDPARQPYAQPCRDCGREHLRGEHVTVFVPAEHFENRAAWDGCVDCWLRRTEPNGAAELLTKVAELRREGAYENDERWLRVDAALHERGLL